MFFLVGSGASALDQKKSARATDGNAPRTSIRHPSCGDSRVQHDWICTPVSEVHLRNSELQNAFLRHLRSTSHDRSTLQKSALLHQNGVEFDESSLQCTQT